MKPHRFFYGWLMLPVATVIGIATSPGQTFAVSVFVPFLVSSLAISQSQLSGAYALGTLLASLPMTLFGVLADRKGLRFSLGIVGVLFGAACLWMSQVQGFFTLFLAFLFLRMLGQGALGIVAMNTLAMWFERRLGLASGISSLGATLAVAVMPALNLWLIQEFGWRHAYVILGVAVWVVILGGVLPLYKNRPEDVGQVPDGIPPDAPPSAPNQISLSLQEAMRTRAYWILVGVTASWSMVVTGITFHMVQLFIDHGLSEANAVASFTTIAVSMAASYLVGGILADRLRLNLLLLISMVGMTFSNLLLIWMTTPMSATVWATVAGLSKGIFLAVGATIWVRYFGRAHLGRIRGTLTTTGVAASAMGPFLMGAAHDYFGGYNQILWLFTGGLYLPITLLSVFATSPRRTTLEGKAEGASL